MPGEKQNDYALRNNGGRLHISQAESGKKGYHCPACSQEMIAHKSRIIRSHFKHDFRDVERKGKCTYSNEEYRKKIAKEALQSLKQIKVPNLYKYPPEGVEGIPNLLKKSEVIKTQVVEIDLQFYEDENGVVKWGRSPIKKGQELIVRPEVTFLDSTGAPTLIVEMVSNFKRDIDQLTKLKRAAIDTIWVKIPRGTEEEIYSTFKSSRTIKWAYNNEQQKTEYLPVPVRNTEFIYEADDDQEKLFEENFECRSSEIGNLIRAIRRCLASESYRDLEGKFRSEISRTERITNRESIELQGIRGAIRERLDNAVRDRRGAIADRRREFSDRVEDLGGRYREKQGELKSQKRKVENQTELVEEEISATVEGLGGGQGSYREQGEEFEKSIERAVRDIEITKRRRKTIQSGKEGLAAEFELAERKIRADIAEETQRKEEDIERRRSDIRDEQETIPKRFKRDKEATERTESEYLRSTIEHIQRESNEVGIELPYRYSELRKIRGFLSTYNERFYAVKRFVEARRSFKSRAYKKWYRTG